MIGRQQFLRFSYKWMLAFILSGLLCLSSLTWAEVATATDGAAETIVAGKMIQGQHAANIIINLIFRWCFKKYADIK